VVGVNVFKRQASEAPEVHRADAALTEQKIEELHKLKARRDADRVAAALARVEAQAREKHNLMPAIRDAVEAYATVGEITARLRRVFGEYQPPKEF
jgi:methylmalonyl-CoA mutase N-terminal domain/subunit